MDSSRSEDDIEQNSPRMASDQKKHDLRKKVLVVGAGAAG